MNVVCEQVVNALCDEFGEDLVSVLLVGSAARNELKPRSDIDILAIISRSWRQRRVQYISGYPVEVMINPVRQLKRELDDPSSAAPTVYMLADAKYLTASSASVDELLKQARDMLINGAPQLPRISAVIMKYRVKDLLDDAHDLFESGDYIGAELLLAATAIEAMTLSLRLSQTWIPKMKYIPGFFRQLFPQSDLLTALDSTRPLGERFANLGKGTVLVLDSGEPYSAYWNTALDEVV